MDPGVVPQNQNPQTDWPPLDHARLLLHRRGLLLEQLFKLCSHAVRGRVGQSRVPLFDSFIIVTLNVDGQEGNMPRVKLKYPEEAELPHGIEMLCFPDSEAWTPKPLDQSRRIGRTYSLVLTDFNGKRKFGYCRRILPEGGNMTLPLVYCIISSKRAYNLYNQILRELEREHGCSKDQESEMLRLLHAQSFPAVGKPVFISHSGKIVKKIRRALDARLDQPNFLFLLRCLGIQGISKVFVTMLLERKIIVTASCLLTLSKAIECLTSLLAPFDWQHLLVPVLPQSLGHLVEAPTPYIIGILNSGTLDSEIIENFSEGVIVQLDADPVILRECGDELEIIPEALLTPLENQLSLVDLFSKETDAIGRHGSPAHNILIFEAFTKFLLGLVGDTSKFLRIKNGKRSFDLRGYLSNCCESNLSILRTFSSTAMFTCYIDEKLLAFYTLKRFEGGPSKLLTDLESDEDHLKHEATSFKFENGKIHDLIRVDDRMTSGSDLQVDDSQESLPEDPVGASWNEPYPIISRRIQIDKPQNEIGISIMFNSKDVEIGSDRNQVFKRYFYLSPTLLFREVLYNIKKIRSSKRQFLINGCITPSPNSKLADLYNVFKQDDEFLHLLEI